MKRFIVIGALVMIAGCASGPVPQPSGDGAATGSGDSTSDVAPMDRRITLSLQNADLKTAFTLISRLSGMNIIHDAGVSRKLTMAVNNRPAGEVLEEVAKTFDMKVIFSHGSTARVIPP